MIYTPGHTPGEIVLLDRKDKMLFCADAIIQHLWMQLKESLPIKTQLESMERLLPHRSEFDKICNGHCSEPYGAEMFDNMLDALRELDSGKATNIVDYEWHGNVSKALSYHGGERFIVYKD